MYFIIVLILGVMKSINKVRDNIIN